MGMTSVPATDPPMADSDSDDRLLFCPFCRECYEGERVCPVHELELVEFQDLPKQAHERALPGWDEPVPPWEPRFGRGWMALGAAACLLGFFLPLVLATTEQGTQAWSGFDVATSRGKNLWTVPFAGAMFVFFLIRRRTPVQMLGARLAGVVLSLMPAASLAYTLVNVQRFADRAGGAVVVEWGVGVWVIAASSVLLLAGSLRFGAMPRGVELPHGAEPDPAPDAGIDTSDEPTPRRKKRRRRRRG
jgi:hypothetical protein